MSFICTSHLYPCNTDLTPTHNALLAANEPVFNITMEVPNGDNILMKLKKLTSQQPEGIFKKIFQIQRIQVKYYMPVPLVYNP